MTTIDAAAAFRVEKRLTRAALASLIGLALAGCETSNNLLGPQAQATPPAAVANPAPAPTPAMQRGKVAIAPVIGAPDGVAKQLQSQLSSGLESRKVGVVTDKADYTLRGYIVAAREGASTKVSYIWDVTDPSGKRVNRITGEELASGTPGKDPWSVVTPQILQTIVDKTATSFVTWLPTQGSPAVATSGAGSARTDAPQAPAAAAAPAVAAARPQATPAAPATTATTGSIAGPTSAIVPTVVGAPGDGGVSLTGAIQRELSRNGVALADKVSAATYRVEGKVSVGAGKDGKQPIQIDWTVKDPKGKQLGTVSQKNEIPQGSLDGAWGKTADLAAAAAAQGIVKLLPGSQQAAAKPAN